MIPAVIPDLSDKVAKALSTGSPVLALESTIISHGMPYPRNVETALNASRIAEEMGVVPAITAIIDGKIKAGLTDDEIDRLGSSGGVLKVSRRDMAFAAGQRLTGATTVSATMRVAYAAGIEIFATGGIGGVHRPEPGSHRPVYDVSADLEEFGRTPVAVVSAGAKAILDLRATLEVLETKGVPVVGFRTDEFPAFYSRTSGEPVPMRIDSAEEVAGLIDAQRRLGLSQGILIANPVSADREIPSVEIEAYIGTAMDDMASGGISGKDITPYLLARIVELSGGRALDTNINLFMGNVRLAAEIALALNFLKTNAGTI